VGARIMNATTTDAAPVLKIGLQLYAGLVGLFLLLPLFVAATLAFSSAGGLEFPPPGFSFRWFAQTWHSAPIRSGFVISAIVATAASVISAVAGTAAAVAINHFQFPGREFVRVLVLVPLTLPGIVIGIAILLVLPWFGLTIGIVATIIGHSVIGIPYVAYMVLASLANYDMVLERASANLGASRWQTFCRITLPLIRPGIIAGTMCAALISFDNIALSLFLSRGDTLPLRLMQQIQFYADPSVAAVCCILILMSVGTLPFFGRAFKT
jgi:putative spermidine/putrescine transport system permease protein